MAYSGVVHVHVYVHVGNLLVHAVHVHVPSYIGRLLPSVYRRALQDSDVLHAAVPLALGAYSYAGGSFTSFRLLIHSLDTTHFQLPARTLRHRYCSDISLRPLRNGVPRVTRVRTSFPNRHKQRAWQNGIAKNDVRPIKNVDGISRQESLRRTGYVQQRR